MYVINKLAMDRDTTWIWFFDFTNATKNNIDVKGSRRVIETLDAYYPYSNNKSIVYGLPWYLSWLKPVFFGFLPNSIKRLVDFYDAKNLHELIDPENLPPHLGIFLNILFQNKKALLNSKYLINFRWARKT